MTDDFPPDATQEDPPRPGAGSRRRPRLDLGGLVDEWTEEAPRERTRMLGPQSEPLAPRAALQPGPFGRFTLESELAGGGMAHVWMARDAAGDRCVIKVPRPDTAPLFRREMEVARRLHHPHVVRALETGTVDGLDFIALEWVDGPSLRALIDRERELPLSFVLHVVRDVSRALAHVHGLTGPDGAPLGLVHRDVSPENVLLSADGRARLADFGIAWYPAREDPTRLGELRGKPRYLAPEQLSGGPLDGRTDLFALGRVLEELLIGHTASPELTALVRGLLAESPAARPPSAHLLTGVFDALAATVAGPTIADYLEPPGASAGSSDVVAASMSGDALLTRTGLGRPRVGDTHDVSASAIEGTREVAEVFGAGAVDLGAAMRGAAGLGGSDAAARAELATVAADPRTRVDRVPPVSPSGSADALPGPRWPVPVALGLAAVALVLAGLVVAGVL